MSMFYCSKCITFSPKKHTCDALMYECPSYGIENHHLDEDGNYKISEELKALLTGLQDFARGEK